MADSFGGKMGVLSAKNWHKTVGVCGKRDIIYSDDLFFVLVTLVCEKGRKKLTNFIVKTR
ncbi:MAG: hypothetical protein IJV77_04640 [Clostridia bacterium]|nr:hypothetical protein [Clostridia bacterium]